MSDEIQRRQPKNLAQAKSFRELLETTLQRYHSRLIDAAAVIAEMLRMKQEMDASDERARGLGLEDEELAFYDAVAQNAERVYGIVTHLGLEAASQNPRQPDKVEHCEAFTSPHLIPARAFINVNEFTKTYETGRTTQRLTNAVCASAALSSAPRSLFIAPSAIP
jgi:hypothetical protein